MLPSRGIAVEDTRAVVSEVVSITRNSGEATAEATHRLTLAASLFGQKVQDIDVQCEEIRQEINKFFEEIERLQGKVRDSEKRIADLKKKKAKFQNGIFAVNSLAAPYKRLPRELMETIFTLCLPSRRNHWFRSSEYLPLLLTRVCWSWYDLARDMPQMWSRIALTRSHKPATERDDRTRYLGLYIARSKEHPIDLFVHANFLPTSHTLALIKQLSSRIITFRILYPLTCRSNSLSFLPSSGALAMPKLETMELEGRSAPRNEMTHLVRIMESSNHLKSFHHYVTGVLKGKIPLAVRCWTKLQTLHLADPIPLHLFFHIIRHVPTLHTISLALLPDGDGDEDEDRDEGEGDDGDNDTDAELTAALANTDLTTPFTHLNLSTLALGQVNDIGTFFELTSLPALRHLILWRDISIHVEDPPWPQDALITFFSRSGCNLSYLQLKDHDIDSSQIVGIMELPACRSTLETLIISCSYSDPSDLILSDSFTKPLMLPEPETPLDDSTLCPGLQTLILDCDIAQEAMNSLFTMIRSRLSTNSPRESLPDPASWSYRGSAPRGLKLFKLGCDRRRFYEAERELDQAWKNGLIFLDTEQEWLDGHQRVLLERYLAQGARFKIFSQEGKWVTIEEEFLLN